MENILFTIFDIFNFGSVVFLWWFTLKNFNTLPERIPVHFDMEGKADGFGGKMYAFLMPVLALGLYALFVYGLRHPEDTNFPVEITAQNMNAQFLIMKIGLRILFLFLAVIFMNIQDYMFRYAVDDQAKPRITFATIFLSVVLFTPALLFIAHLFK
ncbi:DUF1648 domain-containing protein [Chryseobacterium cucumeris]|uniref:DUF1648 domain-containing protein n=1 Tax=Chryseobacterium cucumeris TaxID=1813611 RepID=UPI003D98FF2D